MTREAALRLLAEISRDDNRSWVALSIAERAAFCAMLTRFWTLPSERDRGAGDRLSAAHAGEGEEQTDEGDDRSR